MSGNIFISNGIHVAVVNGAEVFNLDGQKIYELKGIILYRPATSSGISRTAPRSNSIAPPTGCSLSEGDLAKSDC